MQRLPPYIRFLFDLRRLANNQIDPTAALDVVRERLATREDRFLVTAERSIYANPTSPYLALLRWAGCELGDLQRSVRRTGLDATLAELLGAGVYVSFEEFKCRRPIERPGLYVEAAAADFDQPRASGLRSSSGGTTGAPTAVMFNHEQLAGFAPTSLCSDWAHGIEGFPNAMWQEILPSPAGLLTMLITAHTGRPPEQWFYPPTERSRLSRSRYRAATELIVRSARIAGMPLPSPRPLPLGEAQRLAAWAADRARNRGGAAITTPPSRAVRVADAAAEAGIDLSRVAFRLAGEPVSPAKRRAIESSGARAIPAYHMAEAGWVGIHCPQGIGPNDQHLCTHDLGVLTRPRTPVGSDDEVDVLYVTTLSALSSKVMLNVDTDDFGVIEERPCGCPLDDLGLRVHMRDVTSFSKLTGEGVTLVASDAVRVLEEVLPAQFGGGPLDYQLIEEDDAGLTRLTLVVSPRVPAANPVDVIRAFIEGLGTNALGRDVASIWSAAETLRVRREEPLATGRGKQTPLVRLRRPT